MTSAEGIYCLDTSALFFLAERYSADTFPEVWEHLTELAAREIVMVPREVRRELEKKEDNGAFTWIKENAALVRDLDSEQCDVVRAIVSSPRFHGLIDFDAELPDADPFVVALAVTMRNVFDPLPAVVAVDSPEIGIGLARVCQHDSYPVRFLTPYEMLLEMGLDVPDTSVRGLSDLNGIWKGIDSSEEAILASRLQLKSVDA